MTIKFNVPGKKRKELAQAIAAWLGEEARYLGVPSCAYGIGEHRIEKDGTLILNGLSDETTERLLQHLYDESFEFEAPETRSAEADTGDLSLTVSLPGDYFTEGQIDNLRKLVDAKAPLLKEALGVDSLPIEVSAGQISFPWFKGDVDAEHCAAFTSLITAMCRMVKEAKRVNAKEKEAVNPKYEFRCFLLRLGFIGDEFKQNRKILLERLSGSSAFKSGTKSEVKA